MGLKFKTFTFCAVFTALLSTFTDNAYSQVYGGRATGINATTTISGSTTTTVLTDTGPLSSAGGNLSNTSQTTVIPGLLSSGAVFSVSSGVLKSSQSSSVVNNLLITFGGITIRADRISANANCICCPGADVGACSGSVQITALTITDAAGNTTNVVVNGQANQVVNLPNGIGTLTINEQTTGLGAIAVNGLHIVANANGNAFNIVVASVRASIECLTVLPTPAEVTISGRVTTAEGSGIAGATVTVTSLNGNSRSAVTNSFGFYSIPGILAGSSYVVSATSRRYTFESQLINVADNTTVDFIASP